MLSIIRHHERLTVRLVGRLEGSSAEDLRLAACPPSALDIDLSGVTSMDCDGERTLVWLRDHGATLHGEGPFERRLCEGTHASASFQRR
jgi:anti-anti-sigma regulatory factor